VAIGDSSSWTNFAVHGDTQDISQCQLATLIAGQLVYGDTQDISQWQLATPVTGQLLLCMEIHRIYHTGKWRL